MLAAIVSTMDPFRVLKALRQPPENTVGAFAITRVRPPGDIVHVFGMPLNYPQEKVVLQHGIQGAKETIMSTSPQEVAMMLRDAREFSGGNVLVAGLGLGVFPQLVEDRATSITVVEIEPAVVELVWDAVKGQAWSLVVGDAYDCIAATPQRFDFVYLDTWYGTSYSPDQLLVHLKNKALARRALRPHGRVVLWDEEGMRDQYIQDGATIRNMFIPSALTGKFESAARRMASDHPEGREFCEWLIARGGPLMVSPNEARVEMERILQRKERQIEP